MSRAERARRRRVRRELLDTPQPSRRIDGVTLLTAGTARAMADADAELVAECEAAGRSLEIVHLDSRARVYQIRDGKR